jgi:hypothetical protein
MSNNAFAVSANLMKFLNNAFVEDKLRVSISPKQETWQILSGAETHQVSNKCWVYSKNFTFLTKVTTLRGDYGRQRDQIKDESGGTLRVFEIN